MLPAWSAQEAREPLRETQLLALVAGAALPENIVAAIHDRGLSFVSDPDFRAQLEAVGADPRIFSSARFAKVIAPEGAKEAPNKKVQKRIVDIATRYKTEKFPDDPRELITGNEGRAGKSRIWICNGTTLRQQDLFRRRRMYTAKS